MFLFPVCHEVPVAWLQPCCSGCTASTRSHVPGLLSRYFLIQPFVTPQSVLHANACRHIIHSTRKADIANAFLTLGWGYCWHIALVSTGCTTFRPGPVLGKAGGSLHPETTFRLKQPYTNLNKCSKHLNTHVEAWLFLFPYTTLQQCLCTDSLARVQRWSVFCKYCRNIFAVSSKGKLWVAH